MRFAYRTLVCLGLLFATNENLSAASYCWFSGGPVVDGATATMLLKIVVSSVAREQIPGEPGPRTWCGAAFTALGGHATVKLIVPPKNGTVRLNGYRIVYKGDKVGPDSFVVERSWLNWANGQPMKATVVWQIEVVPNPM